MAVQVDRKSGEVVFIFNGYPDAKQVHLAGDFNQWSPAKKRMSKYRDGSFRARMALKPGQYQYKFVADGVWMCDPEADEQVSDPYGGVNSMVRVGEVAVER
jgi:1,4-alpha-glucan branching enzyme